MSNDWIEWKGGECPVPPDTMVEVRYRSAILPISAADLACRENWDWQPSEHGLTGSFDIVAYRVVSEPPGVWIDPTKTVIRETRPDMVNNPPHYTDGGIEAIDYIEAKLGPDGFRSYCVGNALKYISRAGKKGSAKEDLSKAIWYLRRAGGD